MFCAVAEIGNQFVDTLGVGGPREHEAGSTANEV